VLDPEPLVAGAAEAGLDLVDDEEPAVAADDLGRPLAKYPFGGTM
jgi:hypothetical protein